MGAPCFPNDPSCSVLPEITVNGQIIYGLPGQTLPNFGMRPGVGTGFQAPLPRKPAPGPIFTPRQTTPTTQTGSAAPPSTPPPPPPTTPVGEPPPDEPPYSSYDPEVFKTYQEEAAAATKAKAWQELGGSLANLLTRYGGLIYSFGSDFINLVTYSADLGPTATQEAQLVESQLGAPSYAIPPTDLPSITPIPDLTGLPSLSPEPGLQEVTVTAPRPSTAPTPFALPGLGTIPGALLPGRLSGIQANPVTFATPSTFANPITGRSPALKPNPLLGALPHIGLRPGDFLTPDMSPGAQPAEQTQGATQPNQVDCQGQQQKNKDKKKKKKTRNVCHRGTYVELKSGLLKFKKEQIPCR